MIEIPKGSAIMVSMDDYPLLRIRAYNPADGLDAEEECGVHKLQWEPLKPRPS